MADLLREQTLLATLLYATSHGRQGDEMAERLLRRFGSLTHVFAASRSALMKSGLSESHAVLLMTVHSIARRCALEQLGPAPNLRDADTLNAYVRALYIGVCNERFVVLSLDGRGRFIDARTVAEGTMREILLQPRTLLDSVMRSGAASVIFAHNHPGGRAEFSSSDIQSTRLFAAMLRSTGIPLLDHMLCAGGEVVSMRRAHSLPEIFSEPASSTR